MPTMNEIAALLPRLDVECADVLEGQQLDFKEWDRKSFKGAVDLIVETVVCMANGGGGTIVVGVQDRQVGRDKALQGVPEQVDVNQLKKTIYDRTDPKLTPIIEELKIREGTGRLLVPQVHGGPPPYTDTQGTAKMRVGKDCVPLTGSKRAEIMVASGDSDVTAQSVEGALPDLLSSVGMEDLREMVRKNAPDDLLRKSDVDLIRSIGLTDDQGRLKRGGVLLAGKQEAIAQHFPGYSWASLRMVSSTEYDNPQRGHECIATAIRKIEDFLKPGNPITRDVCTLQRT